jgi:hypothetical protein
MFRLTDLQVWINGNQHVETQVPFQDHCVYKTLTDRAITRQCQQSKTKTYASKDCHIQEWDTVKSGKKITNISEEQAAYFNVK